MLIIIHYFHNLNITKSKNYRSNTINSSIYNILYCRETAELGFPLNNNSLSTTPNFVVPDRGCYREGALYVYFQMVLALPGSYRKLEILTSSLANLNNVLSIITHKIGAQM